MFVHESMVLQQYTFHNIAEDPDEIHLVLDLGVKVLTAPTIVRDRKIDDYVFSQFITANSYGYSAMLVGGGNQGCLKMCATLFQDGELVLLDLKAEDPESVGTESVDDNELSSSEPLIEYPPGYQDVKVLYHPHTVSLDGGSRMELTVQYHLERTEWSEEEKPQIPHEEESNKAILKNESNDINSHPKHTYNELYKAFSNQVSRSKHDAGKPYSPQNLISQQTIIRFL
jgi:hypothetical protein